MNLLTIVRIALNAILAPFVADLGSVHFWQRERAGAILGALWPLSAEVLADAKNSADAEVARRAKRAEPSCWREDLAAAGLLTHRWERDGMPYASPWSVPAGRPEWLRASCLRYAEAWGIETEGDDWWWGMGFHSHPTGYERLRFVWHGCWPPEVAGLKGGAAWRPELVRERWRQRGKE